MLEYDRQFIAKIKPNAYILVNDNEDFENYKYECPKTKPVFIYQNITQLYDEMIKTLLVCSER